MAPLAARSGFSAARAKQKGGGQIGVEDLAPLGERELAQRLAHHDAGIGDERVEPAELSGDGLDRSWRRLLIGHIAFDDERRARRCRA